MYFFENVRFEMFTSKDILKPDILQPDILKTWRFVNLMFCKPDVSDVLKTWRFRRFETWRFETWRFVGVPFTWLKVDGSSLWLSPIMTGEPENRT